MCHRNKTQADYERVFQKVLELRPSLMPISILIDFDQGSMNALSTVFPNATVLGCLFHLGKSLWRRIQNEGLSNLYRDDENIQLYSKMLISGVYSIVSMKQLASLENLGGIEK